MKNPLSLLKTTIFLFLALTALSSCDNFLKNGQDVKNEVLDAIAYNNAPSCTVSFSAEGMGEFLGNKKETFKVGYAQQVQFEVYLDDWDFTGLEAVTNDSKKTPLTNYVEFESADSDDSNSSRGIYKFNVTVLKESSDILIRPVCRLLPKIKEILPKFESNGCDQDRAIQITFNKAVDTTTFDPASISIYSDENLAQYFHAPEFTSDNKTINISTKQLILPPNETKSLLGIDVNYDFTGMKDADGLAITAQGTHSYKINKNFGNRKAANVLVQSSSTIGDCLPVGEKEWTVDYFTDIQFTLTNQNYKFIKFDPVISDGTSETPADCVVFQNEAYDDTTGIYKASAKLTKALKDNERLIIRPQCLELPRVVSHTPASATETNFANTPIVINFNMPMEEVGNKISLLYIDAAKAIHEMKDYFELPVFDSEKKKLTIAPKTLLLKKYIDDLHSAFIDITVALDAGISVTQEGATLFLKQDNESNFTVRYNPEIERVAPVKAEFFVSLKDDIPLEVLDNKTAISSYPVFMEGTLEDLYNNYIDEDDERILQNRATDYVYLYGKYYDAGSGVDKIKVTQHEYETQEIKLDSPNVFYSTDQDGYTRFRIKLDLMYSNIAFNINFCVTDVCDNTSLSEQFCVISKTCYTEADVSNFSITNGHEFLEDLCEKYIKLEPDRWTKYIPVDDFDDFEEEYNQNKRTLRLYDFHYDQTGLAYSVEENAEIKFRLYDDINLKAKDFTFYCQYTDKDGKECKEKFSDYYKFIREETEYEFGFECEYRMLKLNVDNVCGMTVNIIAVDSMGVECIIPVSFPEKTYLFEEGTNNLRLPGDISGNGLYLFRKEQHDDDENNLGERYKLGTSGQGSFSNYPAVDYISFCYMNNYDFLLSDFIPVNKPETKVAITNLSVTPDKNHVANITFTFADNTWNDFDYIKYRVINPSVYSEPLYYGNIKKGEASNNNTFTFIPDSNYFSNHSVTNKYMFNDECQFVFVGGTDSYQPSIEGNMALVVDKNTEGWPTIDESIYDDLPPTVKLEQNADGSFAFVMYDKLGSGPKKATINVGTETYNVYESAGTTTITESGNENKIKRSPDIPAYEIMNLSTKGYASGDTSRRLDFHYKAWDVNGNLVEADGYKFFSISYYDGLDVVIDKDNARNLIIHKNSWSHKIETDIYILSLIKEKESPDAAEKTKTYDWAKIETTKNSENNDTTILEALDTYPENIWENKLLLIYKKIEGIRVPVYVHTGNPSTGKHDFLLNYGNSTTPGKFAVSSDSAAFVHLYKTKVPYEECEKWNATRWLMFGEEVAPDSCRLILNSIPDETDQITLTSQYANGEKTAYPYICNSNNHDLNSFMFTGISGYNYVVIVHLATESSLTYTANTHYKATADTILSQVISE